MGDSTILGLNGTPVTKFELKTTLTSFPLEILDHADTLEHIDLSGTGLSSLPSSIGRLAKLKIAFFSNCNFRVFPKELALCPELEMVAFRSNGMTEIPEDAFPPKLRWLILTDNEISELPRSIGKCYRLEKCMVSGNHLRNLPETMAKCHELGLLRLSANHFESLPGWLFGMRALAFLSFAGNPLSTTLEQEFASVSSESTLPEISWTDLQVQDVLGTGASGIVYSGVWKTGGSDQHVAIKLFKGGVTSDGSPMDEMRACFKAGSNEHVIDPLGKIMGHPDNKDGLVMQLIPPGYSTLGLPPSFRTCTRDTFHADLKLELDHALSILGGIARAASHLHARGVCHGDLYAHNIQRKEGHAILGDFGAGSTYAGTGYALERLEVLAFGHLVEDICSLIMVGEKTAYLKQLKEIQSRCTVADVAARPSFIDIIQQLDRLGNMGCD